MRGKIAAVLLLLLLSSCAAPAEGAASGAAEAPAPAAQAQPAQVEHMRSSMVESSARPLLEAEILAAYERAVRVYGWFDLAPLSLSGESAFLDGRRYERVDAEGIEDLEDLRSYLRGVFSRELTDRLLDGETARIQYREVDGALYASGSRRERDAARARSGSRRNSWTRPPMPSMCWWICWTPTGRAWWDWRAGPSPMFSWRTAGSSRSSKWSTERSKKRLLGGEAVREVLFSQNSALQSGAAGRGTQKSYAKNLKFA